MTISTKYFIIVLKVVLTIIPILSVQVLKRCKAEPWSHDTFSISYAMYIQVYGIIIKRISLSLSSSN